MSELTGVPIAPLEPGSQEWLKTISASKIPAVLGISPWQSRFALWHLMAGNTEPWAGNKNTERGTYLEAAVIGWFRARHEDDWIHTGRSFAHAEHSDWTAAPDAFCDDPEHVYGVEVKTAQYSDGWGAAGTAEIPPYYLAQVAWQMIVTGFRRVYVPVLFGQPFEFREYVVTWDDVAEDVPVIIAAVEDFQASLAAGEQPSIDGSDSTYSTIKELHPEIDGETVELPEALAVGYLLNKQTSEAAERAMLTAKNLIADFMGDAKKATWNTKTIFTRQAKGQGKPYLVSGRALPTIEQKEAA